MLEQTLADETKNPMSDPFFIEGPAVISFSGGRTSAYMLYRVLVAGLQPDVHVIFANTGKERIETLDFVHEIETRWQVPIIWVEYYRTRLPKYRSPDREQAALRARQHVDRHYGEPGPEMGYRIVTWETAARNGEPFENLIDMVALPSVTMRLCTQEMKIRPIRKHMMALGYDFWSNVIGLRADEPKRIARMRNAHESRYDHVLPLADAGVRKEQVLDFWAHQPFDLGLPLDENGDTYAGNCDLCFLKSTGKRQRLVAENPEALQWWIDQETRTGMTFRPHGARYIELQSVDATCEVEDDLGDCVCHD